MDDRDKLDEGVMEIQTSSTTRWCWRYIDKLFAQMFVFFTVNIIPNFLKRYEFLKGCDKKV